MSSQISGGNLINGETQWVGLLGYPVGHSFSPHMHNAAFGYLGLNWKYGAFPVHPERLKEAVQGLVSLGFRGANVTVPHKEAVMEYLDEVDGNAARLGAVNTIVISEKGKTKGYNTDGIGFLRGLEADGFSVSGKSAVLLGAGGAARAVAFALVDSGVGELTIVNRSVEKAEALLEVISKSGSKKQRLPRLRACTWDMESIKRQVAGAELLVNATSLGMLKGERKEDYPLPPNEWIQSPLFISDLVYNPKETDLLSIGRSLGGPCQNGLAMLLHQGAAAFQLWTGREAPARIMKSTLEEFVNKALN